MRLAGKVAIITGAGNGIGEAAARLFAHQGAAVIVNDLDAGGAEAVAGSIRESGGRALAVPGDIAEKATPGRLLEAAVGAFGKLDVLVNNAACFVQKGAEQADYGDWQRVLDVNVVAPAMLIKAAAGQLRQQNGSIVNVSSMSGVIGQKNFSTYAASKAALINMTRSLAIDFASDGVRVNAVCPGVIVTSQSFREVDQLGMRFEDWEADLAPRHMLGRLGRPEEVANAILFLASDESSFVTASTLMVDGGFTAW